MSFLDKFKTAAQKIAGDVSTLVQDTANDLGPKISRVVEDSAPKIHQAALDLSKQVERELPTMRENGIESFTKARHHLDDYLEKLRLKAQEQQQAQAIMRQQRLSFLASELICRRCGFIGAQDIKIKTSQTFVRTGVVVLPGAATYADITVCLGCGSDDLLSVHTPIGSSLKEQYHPSEELDKP